MYKFSEAEVKQIANKILKHLYENPNKKDTLEGICEWWLLEERINYAIDAVTAAIEFLLSKKLISEQTLLGSDKLYHLNYSSRKDIVKILNLGMDVWKAKAEELIERKAEDIVER